MEHEILVPLDGSAAAEAVLPQALLMAHATNSTLHLLRVIPDLVSTILIWPAAIPECVKHCETADDHEFRFTRAGSSASAGGVSGGLIHAAVGTAGGVGCPRTNRSGCVAAAALSTTWRAATTAAAALP